MIVEVCMIGGQTTALLIHRAVWQIIMVSSTSNAINRSGISATHQCHCHCAKTGILLMRF